MNFHQRVIGDGDGIHLIQVVAGNFDFGRLARRQFVRGNLLDAGLPLLRAAIVLL
ncbi:MAG: hypothetical protein K6T90_22565 [Leptolyngbyaceae cyanobacterium HOT.MB2.61]|nr:hypothetical protein [Leptolyngbyaceae cyanobacterium HOT.MB2.61]